MRKRDRVLPSVLIQKIVATDPSCEDIFEKKGMFYTFLNPVSYLDAVKYPELYNQFDGVFADGYFLTLAIRLLFHKKVKRCSFDMTSLASRLFLFSQEQGKKIYIIGSRQEEIERFLGIVREDYPNLDIAGFRNGFFESVHSFHS